MRVIIIGNIFNGYNLVLLDVPFQPEGQSIVILLSGKGCA